MPAHFYPKRRNMKVRVKAKRTISYLQMAINYASSTKGKLKTIERSQETISSL